VHELRRFSALAGCRDALIRLVGDALAEQHDEWTEIRRDIAGHYMSRCRYATTAPAQAEEMSLTALTA
jgi:hypothetical protein